MKRIIIAWGILPALLLSCQTNDPEPRKTERINIVLTKAEQEIVRQNNIFAFDLLRTVSRNEEQGKNLLLSPLSASLALAMLNNGAAGQTQQEIQETLGYGNITRDEMNGYFRKMLEAIREADTEVAFETANSIWIRKDFPVLETFKDVNREYYEAEVRNEDFSNPQTVGLINNWCADKTHDKIPDIIKQIDSDVVMYLLNALYFKGMWTYQFDKKATEPEAFANSDGSETLTPVMNLKETLHHREGETFDLLELPYGNESFGMLILLPKEGVSLSSVVDALDAETWENSLAGMYSKEVNLKLPRFKIEYERKLNDDLKEMGMVSMFGPADLSLIQPGRNLYVSMVKQKTFAEVNEEGTEAAAVTVVEMVETALPSSPVLFHATRPFLYFIREQSTGTIFFSGAVQHF
ncbi:MAG: serpin family protein [Tannerellaceae bacterium]|jgi:serpin B|nr:serpin family protein [Tannerellaceae bacterium]